MRRWHLTKQTKTIKNGNPNVNVRGVVPVARECTYQDFVKCQPLNFKGTEGVVGLTRWFEKMETVFHISNCPKKYQVKYASCTLQDSALTWWNSHKRTIGTDAAYAMTWKALMKLMTEMVPEEEDRVEKFIGGLPDNIQGNVIATEPTRLQDAIRIANNLMDQKLKGYTARDAKNKRSASYTTTVRVPLDVETARRLATKQETVRPLLRWHAMDVEEKDTPRGIAQNWGTKMDTEKLVRTSTLLWVRPSLKFVTFPY
ncbi:hypothetical protein Tco_0464959 [Tanacetum coccineum]